MVYFVLSFHFFFFEVKAQQYFVSSSYMFLDKKTLLKMCLNPRLNLTIFRGTEPCRTKHLPVRPAQPRSQSSSAISDVTSPVQASSGHSDSANWPGYEAAACYCFTPRDVSYPINNPSLRQPRPHAGRASWFWQLRSWFWDRNAKHNEWRTKTVHQYGVSIQSSTKVHKTFREITQKLLATETWDFNKLFKN